MVLLLNSFMSLSGYYYEARNLFDQHKGVKLNFIVTTFKHVDEFPASIKQQGKY